MKADVEKLREMLRQERPNVPCLIHEMSVENKVTGLGDVVAAITKAVGIKPCRGCKQRQSWLNKVIPFR